MDTAKDHPVRASIRAQFQYALALSAMGIAFLVIFITANAGKLPGAWRLLPAGAGMFLIAYARHQLAQVRRRKHGLSVEFVAVEQALQILPRLGFAVSANVATRFGDIDLLVGSGTHQFPIEIKAFESWDGRSDRDRAALEQVARMRGHLHARRSYIWLPQAKVGFWRRWFGTSEGATTVIYGDAKRLASILRRREV